MFMYVYMFIEILQKFQPTHLYGSTCLLKFEIFLPYMFIWVYKSIQEHRVAYSCHYNLLLISK